MRVRAASVFVGDVMLVRGSPFVTRAFTGWLRPRYGVPGQDLAGVVEAVGDAVDAFKPGDEVFGTGFGSCAELARAEPTHLAPMPVGIDFEGAAGLATTAVTALHAFTRATQVKAGQRVLINGASGGVGVFAVQIARSLGAEVTGVCSARNAALVRSLGAEHIIDYGQEDFTAQPAGYDVILDNVENRPLNEVRRALKADGTLILNSGTGASGWAFWYRTLKPLVVSPVVRQRLTRFYSEPRAADLAAIAELIEQGKLRPVVDRTFALDRTAEALAYCDTNRARGKVVIQVSR